MRKKRRLDVQPTVQGRTGSSWFCLLILFAGYVLVQKHTHLNLTVEDINYKSETVSLFNLTSCNPSSFQPEFSIGQHKDADKLQQDTILDTLCENAVVHWSLLVGDIFYYHNLHEYSKVQMLFLSGSLMAAASSYLYIFLLNKTLIMFLHSMLGMQV